MQNTIYSQTVLKCWALSRTQTWPQVENIEKRQSFNDAIIIIIIIMTWCVPERLITSMEKSSLRITCFLPQSFHHFTVFCKFSWLFVFCLNSKKTFVPCFFVFYFRTCCIWPESPRVTDTRSTFIVTHHLQEVAAVLLSSTKLPSPSVFKGEGSCSLQWE